MLNLMKFPKALYLYEIEEAEQVLRMYMEHLDKRGSLVIGVDTETTGLDLIKDRPIVYSLYAPVRMHCPDVEMYGETYRLAGWEDTLKVFEPLLTDTRVTKVGSRISAYDWFMINHAEVDMQEPVHDTINMDWLVDENKQHGLKECCRDYLGWRMTAFKSVTGSLDVRTWPFEKMLEYATLDAFISWKIYVILQERLKNINFGWNRTAWEYYLEILAPYQKVLRDMTMAGVPVDKEKLIALKGPIDKTILELQTWFNSEWMRLMAAQDNWYNPKSGTKKKKALMLKELNLNSTAQLKHLFFTLLERPVLKKNVGKTTGAVNPSLDKSVLEEYAEQGCVYAEKLQEFRSVDKIASTYIEGRGGGGVVPKITNGRIFPEYYLGTVTGRLASANPNIQLN